MCAPFWFDLMSRDAGLQLLLRRTSDFLVEYRRATDWRLTRALLEASSRSLDTAGSITTGIREH